MSGSIRARHGRYEAAYKDYNRVMRAKLRSGPAFDAVCAELSGAGSELDGTAGELSDAVDAYYLDRTTATYDALIAAALACYKTDQPHDPEAEIARLKSHLEALHSPCWSYTYGGGQCDACEALERPRISITAEGARLYQEEALRVQKRTEASDAATR